MAYAHETKLPKSTSQDLSRITQGCSKNTEPKRYQTTSKTLSDHHEIPPKKSPKKGLFFRYFSGFSGLDVREIAYS